MCILCFCLNTFFCLLCLVSKQNSCSRICGVFKLKIYQNRFHHKWKRERIKLISSGKQSERKNWAMTAANSTVECVNLLPQLMTPSNAKWSDYGSSLGNWLSCEFLPYYSTLLCGKYISHARLADQFDLLKENCGVCDKEKMCSLSLITEKLFADW